MSRRRAESKPWALFFVAGILAACSSSKPDSQKQPPKEIPVVTDERTDLVLTWTDEEGAHVASSVSDVPGDHRVGVRVQDPKIPPEKRDPSWVFVADLSEKKEGRYRVEAVLRSEFEKQRRSGPSADESAASSPRAPGPAVGQGQGAAAAPVIMYATKTCPVCQKARRWLLETGIHYVEKDVGSDPAAMAELEEKAQAQGVPANGVPVFDVRGKLVPGFDKKIILKLLSEKASGGPGAGTMAI